MASSSVKFHQPLDFCVLLAAVVLYDLVELLTWILSSNPSPPSVHPLSEIVTVGVHRA